MNLGAITIDVLRCEFLSSAIREIGNFDRILDLGCGERPYAGLYAEYAGQMVGVDVPFSAHKLNIDVFSDAMAIPFVNDSFDVVLCSEVLEHVPEPEQTLREIHRVLKTGGVLIMTTPFLVPEHEMPYDFYRYTSFGLRHLFAKTGFEVERLEPFSGMLGVLLSFIVQVQLKLWMAVSRLTRIKLVYSLFNPFVFLMVYLPQIAYLKLAKIVKKSTRFRAWFSRLSYTTKGYGTVARKKAAIELPE